MGEWRVKLTAYRSRIRNHLGCCEYCFFSSTWPLLSLWYEIVNGIQNRRATHWSEMRTMQGARVPITFAMGEGPFFGAVSQLRLGPLAIWHHLGNFRASVHIATSAVKVMQSPWSSSSLHRTGPVHRSHTLRSEITSEKPESIVQYEKNKM